MKGSIKIDDKSMVKLAGRIRLACENSPDSREALKSVSLLLRRELGEYFGPDILAKPDELSISFIEHLDQIIFECEENTPSEESIRDYITEDLHTRLFKYLDIFHDRDIYKQNLASRPLTHEDTIIIRYFGMKEYVPELISEYKYRPALKKSILRSLLGFTSEDLMTFFYMVAKEDTCLEAKILALVGLKMIVPGFKTWKQLFNGEPQFNSLVEYARDFNTDRVEENRIPEGALPLHFTISYIEQVMKKYQEKVFINWVVSVLKKVSSEEIPHSLHSGLYLSVANILVFCNPETMGEILRDADLLRSFILLLEMLPAETFRRVTMALSMQGEEFTASAAKLISEGKVKPREGESNILSYLLWGNQPAVI